MQNQRLKQQQHQALMQQALIQQQSLYHPGPLAAPPQVTEPLLQEVFASTGPVEACKLIRKEKGYVGSKNRALSGVWICVFPKPAGKWLGSRQIRCNWAAKGAGTSDEKPNSDSKSVVELTNGSTEDVKEAPSSDAPENNPQYTTVYVGNLAPEVTQVDLHRHFHALGAGSIEEVRVQRDKGFGFVRYSTHAEAAMAISMGNTQSYLCGKQIKCSWGNKPTPLGTTSNPLPPPAPASLGGLSAADLLAYERQLAMSKMGGVHALMHPHGQHALKQATMGMGAGASQAIYDGGFQNVAAQHLMYYQ
ncbi:hypothetical protein DH2020_016292 [Rehmannia glutinosa]|uniref:RRM domain-containing protein n=1 Tax=Rehmannia glutinosa TaxID=99300 RepID=A0ABR0WR06_REHGL